jgi:hypothetical protein
MQRSRSAFPTLRIVTRLLSPHPRAGANAVDPFRVRISSLKKTSTLLLAPQTQGWPTPRPRQLTRSLDSTGEPNNADQPSTSYRIASQPCPRHISEASLPSTSPSRRRAQVRQVASSLEPLPAALALSICCRPLRRQPSSPASPGQHACICDVSLVPNQLAHSPSHCMLFTPLASSRPAGHLIAVSRLSRTHSPIRALKCES